MSYFLELVNSTNTCILINSRTFLKLLKSRKHRVAQWFRQWDGSFEYPKHKTCFRWEIKKVIFQYALLSGGLVLWMGTLTGCPLCREGHPLCRLKNPTVIQIWFKLLVGFHPATWSAQSTLADNTRKRGSSSI